VALKNPQEITLMLQAWCNGRNEARLEVGVMERERWKRIDELYHSARQRLSGEGRKGYHV